jgi:hypothetical protein
MRNRSSYAVFLYFMFIVTIELRNSLVCKLRLGLSCTIVSFDVKKDRSRNSSTRNSPIFCIDNGIPVGWKCHVLDFINNPTVRHNGHSDTLFWFRANQSLLFVLNAAFLAEKQHMPILLSMVWPDRGSNPWSTTLEANTLTITPPMRF